ncbi:hypothetical protein ACIPSJ_11145 [Streptomyces sp. NPDC090088]|uniref:hypothetical protein n=1 Tax=Streptomyces sp. NPDC090088 TaxID=3365944 RepID=UPI00380A0FCB
MAEGPSDGQGGALEPPPLGIGAATKEAHFVAAPLLTAAALSLAGVVGGADDAFRWPGPTLLLLVVTALTLIFSMQLAYNARVYLYSRQDLADDYADLESGPPPDDYIDELYGLAQTRWRNENRHAVAVYDLGTVLLGLGIAASLAPPDCGRQAAWRWTAAVVVLVCALADGAWAAFWKKY